MGYVFYDTETTGIKKHFDQILQFAAILTDEQLIEQDRIEIRCRLRPHTIPSPKALMVTGVHIDQCTDASLPTEYEMLVELRQKLSGWCPAIFTGWNTIRFDEEFLRQAFYANLFPPYLTNSNGNARFDLMRAAHAASLDTPGAISIPTGAGGRPIFKLDQLAPANGFPHLNAHDALADVEATIHMAKLIRDRAPETWSAAVRFSQKRAAVDFLNTEIGVVVTEAHFGRPKQYALTPIGSDPKIASTFFAIDLTAFDERMHAASQAELTAIINDSPAMLRRVKANASPPMGSLDDRETINGEDVDDLYPIAERIHENANLKASLTTIAVEKFSAEYDDDWPEQKIYSGFASRPDEQKMLRFHDLPWRDRSRAAEDFDDPKYREFAIRLIAEHAPDCLTDEQRQYATAFLRERMSAPVGGSAPWTTVAGALHAIGEERASSPTPQETGILDGLEQFLINLQAD